MAKFSTKLQSASAAIDWHDLKDVGGILEDSNSGMFNLIAGRDTRVAVGVADPGTSNTIGVPVVAGDAVTVLLSADAAQQTIWVQTPASQLGVTVDVDETISGPVIAATS